MNMAGLTPLQMMAIEKMELPTLDHSNDRTKASSNSKTIETFPVQSQQLFSMLS